MLAAKSLMVKSSAEMEISMEKTMKHMKYAMVFIGGIIIGGITVYLKNKKNMEKKLEIVYKRADKFSEYFKIFDRWFSLRTDGITLEKYFMDKRYKTIAIYGMGVMGNHLFEEIRTFTNVSVLYGIDRKGDTLYRDLRIYSMDEDFPEVDAVIVTATFDYMEIENALKKKVSCPIISLSKMIFEV